jgi:flavin reductase (DIM6/NTAB) family NADH-FMN oxidoreductase RutF
MSLSLSAIDHRTISQDVWSLISRDWMLVTAGTAASWNTMTASWGGFAAAWNLDLALALVRPSRYTHEFMEGAEGFTLSFLPEGMRRALELCGSKSGRDCDKAREAGLTPRDFGAGAGEGAASPRIAFEEARLVLTCRKVFAQDLDPDSFVDRSIVRDHYAKGDLHRLYAGAIEGCWAVGPARGPAGPARGPAGR